MPGVREAARTASPCAVRRRSRWGRLHSRNRNAGRATPGSGRCPVQIIRLDGTPPAGLGDRGSGRRCRTVATTRHRHRAPAGAGRRRRAATGPRLLHPLRIGFYRHATSADGGISRPPPRRLGVGNPSGATIYGSSYGEPPDLPEGAGGTAATRPGCGRSTTSSAARRNPRLATTTTTSARTTFGTPGKRDDHPPRDRSAAVPGNGIYADRGPLRDRQRRHATTTTARSAGPGTDNGTAVPGRVRTGPGRSPPRNAAYRDPAQERRFGVSDCS